MQSGKRKRLYGALFLAILLIVFIPMGELSSYAASAGLSGSGTQADPYLIETVDDLNHVRDDLTACYQLANDIVFTDDDGGWNSIGSIQTPFSGIFDGNGYSIKNLRIIAETSSDASVGFFGYLTGTVRNLGLQNCNIAVTNISSAAHTYLGSLVGWCYSGNVLNCYGDGVFSVTSLGTVSGGGIVGVMQGSDSQVQNCYFSGMINASSSDSVVLGGIVGSMSGRLSCVSDCFNMGYVICDGADGSCAGGIIGKCSSGTVRNVYNVGGINGISRGGIFGYLKGGTLENGYYLDSLATSAGTGNDVGTKRSWDEMKAKDFFFGFDFNSVWSWNSSEDYPCPTLRGVIAPTWNFEGNSVEFSGGTGVPWDPYLIESKEHLDHVRRYLNAHFKLINDISFSEEDFAENGLGWSPIGGDLDHAFSGYFDGNGHVIENLQLSSSEACVGLFGYNSGVIQNLGLVNATVTATSTGSDVFVGGIAGRSSGDVKNCYFTGNVSGSSAGGIVGQLSSGTVGQCYATGRIFGNLECGGIVGLLSFGTVRDCYYGGSLSSLTGKAGGIAGSSFGDLSNCYYSESVSGGVGYGTDLCAKCTFSELMQKSTFSGFDFDTVWTMDGNPDYLYPELQSVQMKFVKKIESIEIITKPSKLNYIEGEPFDPTGMEVAYRYNNGQTERIDDYEISGYSALPGTKTLTVSKNGWQASFSVLVVGKSLTSIGISALPKKLVYVEGDSFDATGMVVTAYYDNGTREDITDYILSGYISTVGEKTISVSYQEKTASFPVTVIKKTVTSIAVTQPPAKTTYLEGDSFKKTGMIVTAYYNNGTSKKITDYIVSGYTSTPGTKTICVAYDGKSTSFSVVVNEKTLESVKIIKKPNKSNYIEGETFDPNGMIVKAYYDNDTSEEITDYAYSGYSATPGTKTITVTFGSASATFTVTVSEKSVSSIRVTTMPAKTVYQEGDKFNPDGMIVTAYYNNGTSETVTDYTVRGFTSNPGIKEITVSYHRKTARFSVIVNPGVPSKITSSKYNISSKNISKISVGTPINTFLSDLNEGVFCKVFYGETEVSKEKAIGTGMTVKIMDGAIVKKSYVAVVTGDINGDGAVSITDMLALKAHLLKKSNLSGVYAAAADTSGDGTVSITDFLKIKAKILNKGEIVPG